MYSIELTAPDWEFVADGVSVSQPVRTSWGFVTVTDGRSLIGWTESGEKRFHQMLKRKPSELLCADSSDFIWNVSYDRQYLSYFNPDGVLLWEKKLDARSAAVMPVPGRDGRLFLALENAVICVDINGKTVWSYEINGSQILSLYEKADGSLLINGNMCLSPFGELLSESGTDTESSVNSSVSDFIHSETCDFRITSSSGSKEVTAYDFDGKELWRKAFTPEKVLYVVITDSTIIALSESWTIAGYTYSSIPSHAVLKVPEQNALYESVYGTSSVEKNYRTIVSGLKRIITVINRSSVNASTRDVFHDMQTLQKAQNAGYDFSSLIAEIIMKENDPGVLQTALFAAAGTGRDPDGLIFDAVEARVSYPSFRYDDGLYAAFIDALFNICVTSGDKERIVRAKKTVTPLVTLFNRTLVQKHAAEVLEKLIIMEKGNNSQ
ncbi:MAG: hypothetical protein KBT02_02645 [Treponema sp.]|nr:hypothetical protein [Candidatus Treponema caballi]